MKVSSYCLVSLQHTASQSCLMSVTEARGGFGCSQVPLQAQLVWVLVLVLRINLGDGLVSACALAPGSCGGDVEEGLGLPQLGPSLQVIHVG